MYRMRRLEFLRHIIAIAVIIGAAAIVLTATTKGPDAGGYSGTDSTVYSFVDIAGAGGGASVLAGTDDGTVALTLPFAFQFYGTPYTLICVSSNGALYFVVSDSACTGIVDFANTDLSSVGPPGDRPAVLPLWSDLTFQVVGAGAVFYQTIGSAGSRRFVVQWNNAYPQGSTDPVTFQVVLSESNGSVLFQYKTVSLGQGNPASNGRQASIGLRNTGAPANQQQVAWSFNVPVLADSTALLFSTATTTATPDGLLWGAGFIGRGREHQHFVFRVSQRQGTDYGRLEFWSNDSSRCWMPDHDFDRDRGASGTHDNDYRQNHGGPPNRFRATSMKQVTFSDDPGFRPGRGSNALKPTVDSVTLTGTGVWNEKPGYTFEAAATDQGEPGRGRDTFSIVIRDPTGATVASADGTLTGGNIQSSRVRR